MFAVPGWSVSANDLRVEKESKKKSEGGDDAPGSKPNNKKRKRAGQKKDESVTSANVANLYERVIEGRPAPNDKKLQNKEKRKQAKERKKQKAEEASSTTKNDASASPKESVDKESVVKESIVKESHDEPSKARDEPKQKKNIKATKKSPDQPASGKPKEAAKVDTRPEERVEKNDDEGSWGGISGDERNDEPEEEAGEEEPPQKKAKKDKKSKSKEDKTEPKKTVAPAPAPAPVPAQPKLTPLQASMRNKLISARFRHLNETLYTQPSEEALRLFTDSPDMFSEYHEGFRRQVEVWPENPVDGYINDIKSRAKLRQPSFKGKDRRSGGNNNNQENGGLLPLPRRVDGTCTIADLGCGDARLAATLSPQAKKLKLALRSYDLQSHNEHVTRADIANLPLEDNSVDIAIFCLALMGTNWLDFVEEAYRILRWKGELWVAEIKSRFGPAGRQKGLPGGGNKVVEHSVGHRKKNQSAAGKKAAKADAAADAAAVELDREDLAIEVDGAEDKRGETDVSPFVEALKKRGFTLQAQDMSNKMFVRMLFVKGAAPTKGKGVEAAKAREAAIAEKNKKQKRFVWNTGDEDDGIDESAILKPCVYKIR